MLVVAALLQSLCTAATAASAALDSSPNTNTTTCRVYSDACAANGHDLGHDPASTAAECASICATTPGCCVAEYDSHISRCYLKRADAGALRPLGPGSGISGINCTSPCGGGPSPGPAPPAPPVGPAVPVSVVVDFAAVATPFPPFWKRSFGSGHAALTLRPDWRAQLRQAVRDLGLQGVRFHGLLGDDMGPVVSAPRTYNFSLIFDTWDFQLDLGLVPIVELSFMPAVLANCTWTGPRPHSGPGGANDATPPAPAVVNPGHAPCPATMAYRAVALPPSSWEDWHHLVRALVQAAAARYGAGEVRKWSWEVWNELWGMPFPAQYMALYNATVAAVKGVDARFRVGGPATSQLSGELGGVPAFVNESRRRGLPFDFVSTHFYPASGVRSAFRPCAGGDEWDPSCFAAQMARLREAVPTGTPLYLTEYNAGCCLAYAGHDTSEAAAFAMRAVGELAGVVDVLSWWTFSDVFEEGGMLPAAGGGRDPHRAEFAAVYGAMTLGGVPKPAWRAFQLLHAHAGPLRVPARVSADPLAQAALVSAFATVASAGAPPAVFLSFWLNGGPADYQRNRTATVTVAGRGRVAGGGAWSAMEYRIDAAHANPLRAWKTMGAPVNPSAAQLAQLVAASEVTGQATQLTAEGAAVVQLPPNSAVVLVFADGVPLC